MFNYILEHLEEKNSMYLVLLYFFPFIKHEEDKKYGNFFNTIRYITQSPKMEIKREQVRQWIFQYISFCSWGITYTVRIKMPPSYDLNKSIKSLLKGAYSEDNLNNLLDKLVNSITDGVLEETIDLDMFKRLFENMIFQV